MASVLTDMTDMVSMSKHHYRYWLAEQIQAARRRIFCVEHHLRKDERELCEACEIEKRERERDQYDAGRRLMGLIPGGSWRR